MLSFIFLYVQIETIGDAYCVASGLHRLSATHAIQAAFMALKMMEAVRTFVPQALNVQTVEVYRSALMCQSIQYWLTVDHYRSAHYVCTHCTANVSDLITVYV